MQRRESLTGAAIAVAVALAMLLSASAGPLMGSAAAPGPSTVSSERADTSPRATPSPRVGTAAPNAAAAGADGRGAVPSIPPLAALHLAPAPAQGAGSEVRAVTYLAAATLATSAANSYDPEDWLVSLGVAIDEPLNLVGTITNTTFGLCPDHLIVPVPSALTIWGTPASAALGTSAFFEFFLTSSNVPATTLFGIVDNDTAEMIYWTPNLQIDDTTCGTLFGTPWGSSTVIDSPAAVTMANSVGGSAFLASHPGASELWEFVPVEPAFVAGTLYKQPAAWVIEYETGGTCGIFNAPGGGLEFEAEIDALTGAVLSTYSGACGLELPVTFVETGLPSGTVWSVQTPDQTNSSATDTIGFAWENGTITYGIVGVPGYSASPAYGMVDVNGAAIRVTIAFAPATTEPVTFTESGLLANAGWLVELNDTFEVSSTNSISFSEPAGIYAFTVYGPATGYLLSPTNGNVTVSGEPASVPVDFTALASYTISFTETGLPAGTCWGVEAIGPDFLVSSFSTKTTVNVSAGNGTYDYLGGAFAPNYNTSAAYQHVTVAGSPVPVSVPFTPQALYAVTFTETGLPSGTPWIVGNSESLLLVNSSSGSSIGFLLPNGSFPFVVGLVSAYDRSPASGTLAIEGSAMSQMVAFTRNASEAEYGVAFVESNLPGGTAWNVTVGVETISTTTSTVDFELINGSYAFSVSSVPGFTRSPSSGDVVVEGAPVSQSITFSSTSIVLYTVTFTETGLQAGTMWSVMLSIETNFSTTASVTFAEGDGSYAFTVTSIAGYEVSPATGTVVVDSAAAIERITFSRLYSASFRESGLPVGTEWSVSLNGSLNSSTSDLVGFSVPAGDYPYSIASFGRWLPQPAQGNLNVSGPGATVAIAFVYAYEVLFDRPGGVPSGSEWSVILSGSGLLTIARAPAASLSRSSTLPTISFEEPNGTYSYTVLVASDPSYSASGSVTISGNSPAVTPPVLAGPAPASSPPTNYWMYTALGAMVVAVILGIALVLMRRGSPPPDPPYDPVRRR